MTSLSARLQAVRARIARAAQQYGRNPQSVALLAVSKTWPEAPIAELAAAGQRAFGENQVQEAVDKIHALHALDLEWHFIGALQANKTRAVAENFCWVHSVDRLRVAERLSQQRPVSLPPLSVCIQVNVSGEETKSGVPAADAEALAQAVAALPRLRLRGLMAIPAPTDDFAAQRRAFRCLRELLERLRADGLSVDTLSMGMSDDLEAAIAEGSTLVRVGTAISGERY